MNILLIGGNGFIGSHLIDIFLKNGHEVRVFDCSYERFRGKIKGVDYIIDSIEETDKLTEALWDVDIVFHLVGPSLPSISDINPILDIRKNLLPTIKLLDAMVQLNKSRIVYFSSGGAIYKPQGLVPVPEEHILEPISSYGIIKMTVEKYLMLYERLYGIQPLIIRPSNPYGPRQGHIGTHGVISTFLHRIIKNKELIVFGDGSSVKDYIYISDLIEACYLLTINQFKGIFNIGSGIGYSINEIISLISEITGKIPRIRYVSPHRSDLQNFILNINKVNNSIDWYPKVSLRDGIIMFWNWIEKLSNSNKNEIVD